MVYIGWHSLCFLENSLLKVKQNNFFSPAFSRLNTHKSFHHNFEFLQLFGYFSFLAVSFFDSFTPNLPCCAGFRVIFDLGFSKPEEKLLEPRIINIENLEAHTSFHLEFFRLIASLCEVMEFWQLFSKVCMLFSTHF